MKNEKYSAITLGTNLVSGEKKQKLIEDWISIIKRYGVIFGIFVKEKFPRKT